jgi:hypothetical protein
MKQDTLPPSPIAHRALIGVAVLCVAGVVGYVAAQQRAKPETELALAFLEDVRSESPMAQQRAAGDALAALTGARGESSPALDAARDSRSFQATSTSVAWGSRCVEVYAYGTTRYTLYVEVLEEAEGFRVTRVMTLQPHSGPCAPD